MDSLCAVILRSVTSNTYYSCLVFLSKSNSSLILLNYLLTCYCTSYDWVRPMSGVVNPIISLVWFTKSSWDGNSWFTLFFLRNTFESSTVCLLSDLIGLVTGLIRSEIWCYCGSSELIYSLDVKLSPLLTIPRCAFSVAICSSSSFIWALSS